MKNKYLILIGELFLGIITPILADKAGQFAEQGKWRSGGGFPTHSSGEDLYPLAVLLISFALSIFIGVRTLKETDGRRWDKLKAGALGFVPFFLGLVIGGLLTPAKT